MGEQTALRMRRLGNVAILVAIASVLYLNQLTAIPFYERGEPREGLVVAEMLRSGNFILPLVNGEYIPFKPPLFHWFGTMAVELFGRLDEFTLRLPSALFGIFGVLLTYFAGVRLWSERAGVIAGLILLSNIQWWDGATIVQVDMTLTFFMVASLISFLLIYREATVRRWQAAGFAALLAGATLAKGPLGIIIPGSVIAVFLWLQKDLAFVKRLHPWLSGAVYLSIAGSWYALALWQGGQAFFTRQIIDETLGTATGEIGHAQPLYYFLPIFIANLSPWSFFVVPAFLAFWRKGIRRRPEVLYLFVWLATALCIFSLSSGKRGIYILSLYPAAALLFGAWWDELAKDRVKADRLTMVIAYFVATCYLIAIGAYWAWSAGWVPPRYLPTGHHLTFILNRLMPPMPLLQVGFSLAAAIVLGLFWCLWQRRFEYLYWAFAALGVLAVGVDKYAVHPKVAAEQTFKPFIHQIGEIVDAKAPLYFYRAFDAATILYAGRHVHSYQEFAPRLNPPFYLLLWEEDWAKLGRSDGLKLLAKSAGTGPARRHHMVLVLATHTISP